ncbi:hypothetical protein AA0243_1969 [Novacetimonas hansenii NRIC 0243]|nr:hypothetical protein AA0243_1969 [Novacetimonas hansenii NRIC 0243]
MQPHTKHQQDNANFRQLGHKILIRHKTRGERANGDTRQQITDKHGTSEPVCDRAEYEGKTETNDKDRDKGASMRHGLLIPYSR